MWPLAAGTQRSASLTARPVAFVAGGEGADRDRAWYCRLVGKSGHSTGHTGHVTRVIN